MLLGRALQVFKLVDAKRSVTPRFYATRILPVRCPLSWFVLATLLLRCVFAGRTACQGQQHLSEARLCGSFYDWSAWPCRTQVGLFMALTLHFGNLVFLYLTVSPWVMEWGRTVTMNGGNEEEH